MIIDKLENAHYYYGIDPNLTLGLKYLVEHQAEFTGAEGKKQLSDKISVKTVEYETVVGDRKWESHVVETDLQYVAIGQERFGFATADHAHDPIPTEGKDQIRWQAEGDRIYLTQGYFHIFFPGEVHMSKLAAGNVPEKVTKVVMKIKCEK